MAVLLDSDGFDSHPALFKKELDLHEIISQFDLNGITSALVQLGLAVSLVLFFVWRDWVREQVTVRQREELETFIRTQLMTLVMETNKNITLSTKVIEENQALLQKYVKNE